MIVARRIFGALLWGLSLWLLFSSLRPLVFQFRQTGDLEMALSDPVYYLPLGASAIGVMGGLTILAGFPAGAGMGLAGAVIYALYGLGILVLGGGQEMWLPKLVFAGLMVTLSTGALRLPRTTEP